MALFPRTPCNRAYSVHFRWGFSTFCLLDFLKNQKSILASRIPSLLAKRTSVFFLLVQPMCVYFLLVHTISVLFLLVQTILFTCSSQCFALSYWSNKCCFLSIRPTNVSVYFIGTSYACPIMNRCVCSFFSPKKCLCLFYWSNK